VSLGASPALWHSPQEEKLGLKKQRNRHLIGVNSSPEIAPNLLLPAATTPSDKDIARLSLARELGFDLLPLPFYPINQGTSVTKVGI